MKAVILLAGAGTRLHPLTLDRPKSLLPIGDSTVLEQMIQKLRSVGIESFVVVCGFMEQTVRAYLAERFPELDVVFVTNERYRSTNTARSLYAAREHLCGHAFVKLDGDVIFDVEILRRLLARRAGPSYVCVDHTEVTEEVIKVSQDAGGRVRRIGNDVPVADASGESIGIELVSIAGGVLLFEALAALAADATHDQSYYEVAYDRIVQTGAPFEVVDITGLRWVEMDDLADHDQAQAYFGTS